MCMHVPCFVIVSTWSMSWLASFLCCNVHMMKAYATLLLTFTLRLQLLASLCRFHVHLHACANHQPYQDPAEHRAEVTGAQRAAARAMHRPPAAPARLLCADRKHG